MSDRSYGGREIPASEAGTQAAKEIERREAAERDRLQRQAEQDARNREAALIEHQKRLRDADRDRHNKRELQQIRNQGKHQAKNVYSKSTHPPSSAPPQPSKRHASASTLIALIVFISVGGWIISSADTESDGRLLLACVAAIVCAILAKIFYKIIISVAIIATIIFVVISIFSGSNADVSATT